MQLLDWLVMLGTLLAIVIYGVLKTRNVGSVQSYLRGDRDLHWWTIGLSVMATQASAITFLSTPGQAYSDGMGFAQFYFGLPVAMVILCIFVLPIYYRLNVYTAYEYLEGRFDLRTRTLTAILFLTQRGLAAGITIYAPAIILSSIMNWSLNLTILFIGTIVTFYTVIGGTKAVSVTQRQQMIIILSGMILAGIIIVYELPAEVQFTDALNIAGKMGKLEVVDFTFDLNNRYNFWSGMLGGVFLFLSYFGTDQSQVQRYLSGKSLSESRLGLLFNGLVKVPMQFMILFIGILVYVFFLFTQPPIHFNSANLESLQESSYEGRLTELQSEYDELFVEQRALVSDMVGMINDEDAAGVTSTRASIQLLEDRETEIREQVDSLILLQNVEAEVEDGDYVFITFVINYLPVGIVGLILAVIFSAAMSSTSSELSALATTSMVDIYRRSFRKHESDQFYLGASKWATILWGVLAVSFAFFASLFENLIEAVNIIGSIFYGVILGIFVVAFLLKHVGGRAVFIAAILAELAVITIFVLDQLDIYQIAYLWLNLIGCLLTVLLAVLFNLGDRRRVAY